GATFVYFDELMRPRGAGWGDARVRIVAHAGPIPSDVVAASARLPDDMKVLVQEALLRRGDTALARAARDLVGADGFVLPTREHLDPLIALLPDLEDAAGRPHSFAPRR